MAQIKLKVPETATHGEVVEVKAMIQHAMESGYRRDSRGEAIGRNIITKFECEYDGDVVFSGDFGPGMAANPILTFYVRASLSGKITFRWTEQGGAVFEDSAEIDVT